MTAPVETIESLRAERDHWKAEHSVILKKWTESTLAGCRWVAAYHDMRRKAELCYATLQEQWETITRMAKLHAELASCGGGGGDGEEGGGGAVSAAGQGAPIDKSAQSEDEEYEQDDSEDDEAVNAGCLYSTHSEGERLQPQ